MMKLLQAGKEILAAIEDIGAGATGDKPFGHLAVILRFHATQIDNPNLAKGLERLARRLESGA